MTRKDLELVAQALADARRRVNDEIAMPDPVTDFALEVARDELANAFARHNPRFNRERFLKAVRER